MLDDYQEALLEIQRLKQVEEALESRIKSMNNKLTLNEEAHEKLNQEMTAKLELIKELEKGVEEGQDDRKKLTDTLQGLQDQIAEKDKQYQDKVN